MFVWQHVNIRYAQQKTEDSVSSVSAAFDITEESVHNIYISSIDCSSEYSTDIVTYIRKAQWKQHLFHFCLIIMSCFIGFWIYWKRNLSYIWVGRYDFGMCNVQFSNFNSYLKLFSFNVLSLHHYSGFVQSQLKKTEMCFDCSPLIISL